MSKTAFQLAAERRKQQEAARNAKKGSFSGNFEQIKYGGIPETGFAVGRFVGNPAESRELPWHAKIVYMSEIIGDDNKYKKIVWPQQTVRINDFVLETGNLLDDWFFKKIFDVVFQAKWEEWDKNILSDPEKIKQGFKFDTTKGKIVNGKGHTGFFRDLHVGKPSYDWLKNNTFPENKRKYIPNSRPSTVVMLPWIDRSDNWCRENAKTKIFATKYNVKIDKETGKENVYTSNGVTISWYKQLFDAIEKGVGDLEAMDLVCWKIRKPNSNQYDYTIKHITEMVPEEAKKIGNADPITEVERNYKHHDLDKIFQYTRYAKIAKAFQNHIKQVDIDFNEHFSEMLVELCKIEAEQLAKEKKESNTTTFAPNSYDDDEDSTQEESENNSVAAMQQAIASRAERSPRVSDTVNKIESECESYFPFWSKLPAEDKAEILKNLAKFENDLPVWSDESKLLDCDNLECKYPGSTVIRTRLPSTVYNCPCCGTNFA